MLHRIRCKEGRFTDGRKLTRELIGLFLLFWALLVLLSLLTFDATDPSLNHVVSGRSGISNKAGLFGAYISGFLNDVFGIVSYIWPILFTAVGITYITTFYTLIWWRWGGYFLLTLCLLVAGAAFDLHIGDVRGGGMVGHLLFEKTCAYLSPSGAALVWFFVFLAGIELGFGVSWISLFKKGWTVLCKRLQGSVTLSEGMRRFRLPMHLPKMPWKKPQTNATLPEIIIEPLPPAVSEAHDIHAVDTEADIRIVPYDDATENTADGIENTSATFVQTETSVSTDEDNDADDETLAPSATEHAQASPNSLLAPLTKALTRKKLTLPPLDLLSKESPATARSQEDLQSKGNALVTCLNNFDIKSDLVRITPGPVVTMFEVRPAAGIRVNRIANLADDLALALKAMAVRIQAPIPGSDTVGIEIPNEQRQMVNFRSLLESVPFRKEEGVLNMALGKDIAGQPFTADLARMPHLLVAGATGAGKSVCLNSILLSFLYKARPDEVNLLLVDPKRIEMAAYADLPHLVHPVVTEMSHAKTALDWAVHEMDKRFVALGRLQVRGVAAYNQKLASFGKDIPEELADLEPLPYLVIIIDELADLMLTAAREVETSIVRLAQLARAAGIHMILATQRPSVDVVTGLIKANFPCRISFQVTSKHDSRTILDTVGAEYLLGKGDMLFKHSGGRLQRLHGPFVSDEEVQAVVDYWKRQAPPNYKVDFSDWGNEGAGEGGFTGGGDGADNDPLYAEVQAFVMDQGKASISFIQRRFKIGFNRAARLVEQLERDGVIIPAEGGKSRIVVR